MISSILDQHRKSLGYIYDAGQLDWVPATASAGGGDGAILDGVSSSIKATVKDYTNSNPLATVLVDTNGDPISVGGGTQYTEDAAAAANPVGTAVNLIRQDTPGALVTTDGDNVAQRGTNFGAGFVQVLTSAGAFVDSFGGGTQYTEDAAAAANPVGTALNLVRLDTPVPLVTTDGDNVAARGTNFGALYVSPINSVDGTAIDFATDENLGFILTQLTAGATAIAKAEDVASVTGDVGVPAMAIQRATPANTAADLDYSMLQMSAGRLWASATIDAAIPAGSNIIGALVADQTVNLTKISGTAASVNSGVKDAGTLRVVIATDQPALTNKLLVTPDSVALPANQSVNVSQINGVTPLMGAGNTGTGSHRVTIATDQLVIPVNPGTAANWGVYVEDAAETVGGNLMMAGSVRRDTAATSAGTTGDNATINTDSIGLLWTRPDGGVAHDAADAGNPVKVGFKAETSPKGITAVADGDRTDAYADADGMQMTKLNTSFGDLLSEVVTNTNGTSTAFTNFSAVANTKNYVTAITVMRTDTGTTLATVDFRDGTAGAVLWTMPLPPNGGSVIASAMPLFKTSANTALAFDVSAALTTVTINVSGFQSKVG